MSDDTNSASLNLRQQIIHIDHMQADIRREQQETRLVVSMLIIGAMTAGALLAGAVGALTALAIKVWGL